MAGKKTGKRLLTQVLVLVMALSLLPLNALADESQPTVFTDAEAAREAKAQWARQIWKLYHYPFC